MSESESALGIHWTFGFSKDLCGSVQNLTTNERNALVFLSSHSAVIYNYEQRTQQVLQGHKNVISCCTVSTDKRWIVTSDVGEDSIIVIWDSISGTPAKTIFNPHPCGIVAVDISPDALYIAALSGYSIEEQQEICIYAWTRDDGDTAILREKALSNDVLHSIKFDTSRQTEVVTTGPKAVCFWTWENFRLEGYVSHHPATFKGSMMRTVYLPDSDGAVTCTDDGHLIMWENKFATTFLEDPTGDNKLMRSTSKVIKVCDGAINCMDIINEYVAIACGDGSVKFYDFSLRMEAWYEDIRAGPITSLSFSMQESPFVESSVAGAPGVRFWAPDFIIGTSDAFIVGVESECFHNIQADERRGTLLIQGLGDDVTAAVCHPYYSQVVLACYSGVLQVWDYESKILVHVRDFNEEIIAALAATTGTTPAEIGKSQSRALNRTQLNKDHTFLRPLCLTFEGDGEFLAVGFSSGIVKFIHSKTLHDIASFAPSTSPILCLKTSLSGNYLGGYDGSNHVLLFGRIKDGFPGATAGTESGGGGVKVKRRTNFEYIGRIHAHTSTIVGIEFGRIDDVEVLMSVGKDKRSVQYDCDKSTPTDGVQCYGEGRPENKPFRLDLTAHPTAVLWLPYEDDADENIFVIANDQFKFKEYNAENKNVRKVTRCPSPGGCPKLLLSLPTMKTKTQTLHPFALTVNTDPLVDEEDEEGSDDGFLGDGGERQVNKAPKVIRARTKEAKAQGYYIYACEERMIGIGCLPLTGNSELCSGVVAHPGKISSVAVSADGKYMFSCGGADLSVNMWSVNTTVFQPARRATVSDDVDTRLAPFMKLLEGGKYGPIYSDLLDYLIYFQLRAQGEDSMEERAITNSISVDNIPEIMNAIGLYLSQDDFANMMNEVRYATFFQTGQLQNFVSLEELVKLYLNHLPQQSLLDADIQQAFNLVCQKATGGKLDIPWKELRRILTIEGEPLSLVQLQECLGLLMEPAALKELEAKSFDSRSFCASVLGFDDTAMNKQFLFTEGDEDNIFE